MKYESQQKLKEQIH